MNEDFGYDQLRDVVIGTVESVSPREIKVLLEINAPQNTAINNGVPTLFPKINGFILEKRMNSVNEIMLQNQPEMENTLKWYLNKSNGTIMYLDASLDGGTAPDKLKMWINAAHKVLGDRSVKFGK